MARIGVLAPNARQPVVAPLVEALAELGWQQGRNLLIEIRSADDVPQRLDALATELVRLPVDAIVTVQTPAVHAARRSSASVPIVTAGAAGDPVASGLVQALARPGGNVTGIGGVGADLADKAIELAMSHRLVTFSFSRAFALAGGLLTYSTNNREIGRRVASFVDRILKGANPAEMPVEQPTTFDLFINLRSAKALGLSVAPSLMLRATEVIK